VFVVKTIGMTLTAQSSEVTANREARRTACVFFRLPVAALNLRAFED
jgi:hypothetical protein